MPHVFDMCSHPGCPNASKWSGTCPEHYWANEAERLAGRLADVGDELLESQGRERDLRAKLAMVETHIENVWRWQGDGLDKPESLSCPVVMSAETAASLASRGTLGPAPTFEEAWAKKEAEGYQYGADALEGVRLGWKIRDGYSDTAPWTDAPLPEDAAIEAARPTRTGRHDLYAEAMRLVGARQSKGALVDLVNWLLAGQDEARKLAREDKT